MPEFDAFEESLLDFAPSSEDLTSEVCRGLAATPKRLPSKFFYDAEGSRLFDRICELPEYYPTRTEMAIMQQHLDEMVACLGPRCLLVEMGSGSSTKTRLLLDRLEDPVAYVPLDISREHLLKSAAELAARYPELPILPVCADYLQDYELPEPERTPRRRIVYFPGSTIGNYPPETARRWLDHAAEVCGVGGGLLIGVDLRKDPELLVPAYADSQGITAAFNYNLLHRINRETGADFAVGAFEHRAVWNEPAGRMESHLVSLREQCVHVGGQTFCLGADESIWTESSYKYTLAGFAELARAFTVERVWTDPRELFSVQYLSVR